MYLNNSMYSFRFVIPFILHTLQHLININIFWNTFHCTGLTKSQYDKDTNLIK